MLGFPIATYAVGAAPAAAASSSGATGGTGGTGGSNSNAPPSPTAADINLFTIMQTSTINLQANLGPAAINLTVSLS